LRTRLRRIRHVAPEMDGTIYCGDELFPQTLPVLRTLRALGIGFTFLTNNSSTAEAAYLPHLMKFGIDAKPGDVFTSTHAAIALLRHQLPAVKRLFIVGTADFRRH
jgi:NagD protein